MSFGGFLGDIMANEYRQVSPTDIAERKEQYLGGWKLFAEYLPSVKDSICMLYDMECIIFGEHQAFRVISINLAFEDSGQHHKMTNDKIVKLLATPKDDDVQVYLSQLPYEVQVYYAKKHLQELIQQEKFEQGFNDFVLAYQHLEYGHADLRDEYNKLIAYKPKTDVSYDYPIKIYRGFTEKSTHYAEALSWTTSLQTAKFFANRYQTGTGYVIEAEIHEGTDFYDVGNERVKESEILVDGSEVLVVGIYSLDDLD